MVNLMTKKQKIAIVAPLMLMVSMYVVYHLLSRAFSDTVTWYVGFLVYWGIWGAVYSFSMIGKHNLLEIIRPRKPNKTVLLFVAVPILIALVFRMLTGIEYDKGDTLWHILIISTAFGNGFFEEVLWRGVYMSLFPKGILHRIILPALWFGLWHYLPGSVSPNTNVVTLMVVAGAFGLYLGLLAKKTNTVWWPIVVHTLGGIVMLS